MSICRFASESPMWAVTQHHSLDIEEEEEFRAWLNDKHSGWSSLDEKKLDELFHRFRPDFPKD